MTEDQTDTKKVSKIKTHFKNNKTRYAEGALYTGVYAVTLVGSAMYYKWLIKTIAEASQKNV